MRAQWPPGLIPREKFPIPSVKRVGRGSFGQLRDAAQNTMVVCIWDGQPGWVVVDSRVTPGEFIAVCVSRPPFSSDDGALGALATYCVLTDDACRYGYGGAGSLHGDDWIVY